jgi:hypothetical protein
VSIAEALVAAGLLAPTEYDDPKAIAAALERATIEIKNCHSVTPWLGET